MRLGQVPRELDRAPDVIDRPRQQRRVGLVAGARHLVLPEPGVAECHVGEGVTRIERDRALEVGDRTGDERRVERLEPNAAVGERLIGFQADGFAVRASAAAPFGRPQRLGELRHDPVLDLEHLLERTVRLGVGQRHTRCGIDDACGDAQSLSRALEAADDSKIELELGSERRQVRADAADTFDDPHAIDDPVRAGRAQVVGHGLGNAGREPGKLPVRADVGEIQHADERDVLARRLRLDDGRCGLPCDQVHR